MNESIENIMAVLDTHMGFLKEKIEANQLSGEISNISKMKDEQEKERIIYILKHISINAVHFINKILEEEQ